MLKLTFNKWLLLAIPLLFCSGELFGQIKQDEFSCPTSDGLSYQSKKTNTLRTPSKTLNLFPKDGKVFSVSSGIVKSIRIKDSLISLYVVHKNYFIAYTRLRKCDLKEGEEVMKGQCIGLVSSEGNFHFSIYKDDSPIDPYQILNCKKKQNKLRMP